MLFDFGSLPGMRDPGGILKRKAKLIVNENENILFYKHENYVALNKMCWQVNFCHIVW